MVLRQKNRGDNSTMTKLQGLSHRQVQEISRQIADAFYDYEYNKNDAGLIRFIPSREAMFIYIDAIVQAAYKSGVLYTTSDRHEGYLMLSGEGAGGSIGLINGIRMIAAEKKALGGLRNMKKFIDACFSDGGTIETRMQKEKRRFLRIEMLVVRKEYQGQGYMRQMMEHTYRLADKKHLPVILDTDDKDKAARYEHLGMTLDRVRNCGKRFHMYDLIREWDTAKKTSQKTEQKALTEEGYMELKFGDIQETALIPLAIKASETKRPNARIRDEKAKEIIETLLSPEN